MKSEPSFLDLVATAAETPLALPVRRALARHLRELADAAPSQDPTFAPALAQGAAMTGREVSPRVTEVATTPGRGSQS